MISLQTELPVVLFSLFDFPAWSAAQHASNSWALAKACDVMVYVASVFMLIVRVEPNLARSELASMLVRFDNIASFIVNADHSIV